VRYRVRVLLSSAPGPADHTHEGAQPKRVEHDVPADASDISGVAAQLKRLQTSAGNQAVNRLLRRFTTGSTAIARMPLVQRDDPQAQQSFATKPPPDFSKLAWPRLLPSAHGAGGASITKIDLHTPGNGIKGPGSGAAPTFTYKDAKDIRTDPATGTPQGGVGGTALADAQAAVDAAALKAAGDAAVQQIVGGRSSIPDRPMKRSANNNAGYDYNPDTDPTAKDYNTWSKSALPTGVQATDWNWQVFKKIQDLEGQEGRLTTFDKTLTVGPGYSTSAGQGQQVLAKTFDALPEVKAAAFAAGLTADSSGGMTVVDTDKKWILTGQDAAAYVQVTPSLLSLIVNISQGTLPIAGADPAAAQNEQTKQRQTFLDAEWQQFLDGSLNGVSSLVKGWPLDSAVLAVHAKHAQPAKFPYSFWTAQNGPDLRTMVTALYATAGPSAEYITGNQYAPYHTAPAPTP
jgi:hypothetical protein